MRGGKGAIVGFVVGVCLSILSFVLAWIAPQFARPGSFDDIVAVLIPILPGLLLARGFLILFDGEITSWFYIIGHVLNVLIFVLLGALIGRFWRKK